MRRINLAEVKTADLITELERRNGFMHKNTSVDLTAVSTVELLCELHERCGFGKGIDIKYVNPNEPFHIQVTENGRLIEKEGTGPAMIIVVTD